jgi:hypothetical protein
LGVAGADQTIYGPSGLVLNPTADVAPVGMTEGSVMWFNQDNTPNGGMDVDWLTLNAVGGTKRNTEFSIGYARLDVAGGADNDGLTAGLKVQVAQESERLPAIAAGFSFFDAGQLYERTAVYLCASKDLAQRQEGNIGLRGTAGIRWADADYGLDSDSDIVPFVGVEALIAPKLSLVVEVEGEHSFTFTQTNTPYSAVLRYRPTDNLVVHGGVISTGFDDGSSVAIGVSYIWEQTGWR